MTSFPSASAGQAYCNPISLQSRRDRRRKSNFHRSSAMVLRISDVENAVMDIHDGGPRPSAGNESAGRPAIARIALLARASDALKGLLRRLYAEDFIAVTQDEIQRAGRHHSDGTRTMQRGGEGCFVGRVVHLAISGECCEVARDRI